MRIMLWANIESFTQAHKADRDWAEAYAEGLRRQGHDVSLVHPLLEKLPETDLIHVIGAGRRETLPALAGKAKYLWLSPAGLAGGTTTRQRPEPPLSHWARLPWRMARQRRIAVECDRAWLRPVTRFVWPSSGRVEGWPGKAHGILPPDPAQAAALADQWLKAEAGFVSP